MNSIARRTFLVACAVVALGTGRASAGEIAEHSYRINVDGMT